MSNLGKWDRWYYGLRKDDPQPYGDTATYQLGADWLQNCALIEDWGCGKGWFSRFVPTEKYRGVDGSHSPFAGTIVDLSTYRSNVSGIYMRHVIEHNYEWRTVLLNALNSFTDRMVLVLFTPMADETHEIFYSPDPGVPDISFSMSDLITLFELAGVSSKSETLESRTNYGEETIFYLEK